MGYCDELFSLKGKKAVVIGGGGVLAGAMAEGLAKAGADVAILDLNLENAQRRSGSILKSGIRTMALKVDVSNRSDLLSACDRIVSEWSRVDILVNAPGFFPAEQNLKLLTEERTDAIMRHTPMNRFGEPEELIGTLLWLASDRASSFVTGAIIRVDGGFSAMTI